MKEVDALGTELDDLVVRIKMGDKTLIGRRDTVVLALVTRLTSLALNVSSIAEGSYELLLTTGFQLYKHLSPVGPLSAPKGLTLKATAQGGIKARIEKVDAAASYLYEWTPDPISESTVWESASITYLSFVINKLQPVTKYSVRVGAVNKMGEVLYCDPVCCVVI